MNSVRLRRYFWSVAAAWLAIALLCLSARAEKKKNEPTPEQLKALEFGEDFGPPSLRTGVMNVTAGNGLVVYKYSAEKDIFKNLPKKLQNGKAIAVVGSMAIDKTLHQELHKKWQANKFPGDPFATVVAVPNLPEGCDITGKDAKKACTCSYVSLCVVLNPPKDFKSPTESAYLAEPKRETCEPQADGSDAPTIDQAFNLMKEGLSSVKTTGSPDSVTPPVCQADEAAVGYDLEANDPEQSYGYEGGIKSMEEFDQFLCLHIERPKGRDLFKLYQKEYRKYVVEAAKALRLPPAYVGCTLLIESSFDKNKVSPRKAKGMPQVLDETADALANLIQPQYQTCEQNYQDGYYSYMSATGGDPFAGRYDPPPADTDLFTQSSIQTTARFGVFGSALFYREEFDKYIGEKGIEHLQKNPDQMRFLFELGVVGYNAGAARLGNAKDTSCDQFTSRIFTSAVLEGKKSPNFDWEKSCLTGETKEYIRKVNDCMDGANLLNYGQVQGGVPPPEEAGLTCKRMTKCGINPNASDTRTKKFVDYCDKIMKQKVRELKPMPKPKDGTKVRIPGIAPGIMYQSISPRGNNQ